MEEICIQPNSPAGRMLGFSMPTYFNRSTVAVVTDPSKILEKLPKRCPPNVFNELVELASPSSTQSTSERESKQSDDSGKD